jgi:hypothetical protein
MGIAAAPLAIIGIISSVAGAAMTAYSSMESANYNAQVARNNQTVANQNASIALQQGQAQEQAKRIQTGEMMGGIVASQAASGVNPNEGSALSVRSSAVETGELDAETIRSNSNLQARNLQYQGAQYGAQASMYSSQVNWDVGNSILGGASSVSNKWLQYNYMGVPGFNLGNTPGNPIVAGPESVYG